MSAQSKRLALSRPRSASIITAAGSEEWIRAWREAKAKDLVESSKIVSVDAECTVEEACEALLSENAGCLAVKSQSSSEDSYLSLFDFSDVNAFLTFAATRHTLQPEELKENPRIDRIVAAAKTGRIPVHLVSNLSEKNPLQRVSHDADILSLLAVFSRGTHRVLIQSPPPSSDYLGIVSDRRLLSWFFDYAEKTPTFMQYLSNSLQSLPLPSLNLYTSVIAATSASSVLDAMKLMSEQGVSSVAVIKKAKGTLLSAVSVTDIGKLVVPSQSNQILSMPLHQFVSQIKEPDGSTDGVDKYPVYSVLTTSDLSYTIQKLLATNAHRLFVTNDTSELSGIVSVVDILSLFAVIAQIPGVDPTRMQRHRRASSSASSRSSRSSRSDGGLSSSRSSSRSNLNRQSPIANTGQLHDRNSGSITNFDVPTYQWTERERGPLKD